MNNCILNYDNIIKVGNPDLRCKCEDVKTPISKEDEDTLNKMNQYLEMGYDEEEATKNNIRPGVGIAAPQIDILKKMFVLYVFDEDDVLYNFGVVNPKILSHSEELTYLPSGEGCLSVPENVSGLVHRPKRIKVNFDLYDFETKKLTNVTMRLKNYISVVFQHENDHLYGKLYFDHINKDNPMYVPDNSTPIKFKDEEEEK